MHSNEEDYYYDDEEDADPRLLDPRHLAMLAELRAQQVVGEMSTPFSPDAAAGERDPLLHVGALSSHRAGGTHQVEEPDAAFWDDLYSDVSHNDASTFHLNELSAAGSGATQTRAPVARARPQKRNPRRSPDNNQTNQRAYGCTLDPLYARLAASTVAPRCPPRSRNYLC